MYFQFHFFNILNLEVIFFLSISKLLKRYWKKDSLKTIFSIVGFNDTSIILLEDLRFTVGCGYWMWSSLLCLKLQGRGRSLVHFPHLFCSNSYKFLSFSYLILAILCFHFCTSEVTFRVQVGAKLQITINMLRFSTLLNQKTCFEIGRKNGRCWVQVS